MYHGNWIAWKKINIWCSFVPHHHPQNKTKIRKEMREKHFPMNDISIKKSSSKSSPSFLEKRHESSFPYTLSYSQILWQKLFYYWHDTMVNGKVGLWTLHPQLLYLHIGESSSIYLLWYGCVCSHMWRYFYVCVHSHACVHVYIFVCIYIHA